MSQEVHKEISKTYFSCLTKPEKNLNIVGPFLCMFLLGETRVNNYSDMTGPRLILNSFSD